jgi:kynureninase
MTSEQTLRSPLRERAVELDEADEIAFARDRFVPAGSGDSTVQAYLDGNSLGRPLRATQRRINELVEGAWGTRLIRSWDEEWMELPLTLGDRIGEVVLGAAPGQTFVGDSTTVILYKLIRAAVAADPSRTRIVLDSENFPTDRYVAEGIAAETGTELVWIEPDPSAGVTVEQVAAAVDERTALVLVSHVAYKSAWIADLVGITEVAHDAGALVLSDTCHSAGVVREDVDAAGIDLVVGCSYKFLNGGPGAPAYGYVAARHQDRLRQPIQGWMGHAEPFRMGPGYRPSEGMRRFISGTPPVLGMVGIADTVDLVEEAGLDRIRAKSTALTRFVIDAVDDGLAGPGVQIASPRADERRGAHVTITHPRSRELCAALWARDVIPDFREPDGIRLGLAPLSTSFGEVATALEVIASLLGD